MVTERRRKKMKDFFEELGKYIGETATTVGNKAGEVIETQKLKLQVRSLAHENTVDLQELGRGVYEQYKSGAVLDEKAEGLCEAISSREELSLIHICFVQFLTPYYREIVVVDPRYYSGTIEELLSSYRISEVLFLYSGNTFFTDNNISGVLTGE